MGKIHIARLQEIYDRYKTPLKDLSQAAKGKKLNVRHIYSVKNTLDLPQDSLEKVRGLNNLTTVSSFLRGFEVGQSVGLIFNPRAERDNWGIGTGFLIAPNLLITNNHVISTKEEAEVFQIKMNFQRDLEGNIDPSFDYELQPDDIFVTDERLDFTIVSVASINIQKGKDLKEFGYLKLFPESGKAIKGNPATIIQHPNGRPKQTAYFENTVENDKHEEFITYKTDTMIGSSGSPVFNYEWVVFALHHSGVPSASYLQSAPELSEENDIDVLKIDGLRANEGIRISAILKRVEKLNPHCSDIIRKAREAHESLSLPFNPFQYSRESWSTLVTEDINSTQVQNEGFESTVTTNKIIRDMNEDQNIIRVNIPLEIRLGNDISIESKKSNATEKSSFNHDESINPKSRIGFDSDFLGNGLQIDLRQLCQPFIDKKKTAELKDGTLELKYTHFSILMHKIRKMCILAAVNIDGAKTKKISRKNDKWATDDRLDKKYQLDNSMYYKNDLDRGHMVRRVDPNWGNDAEKANRDTFFYTNATPQHKGLNQKEWLKLEDYVLGNTKVNDLKVSVITGPVLDDNYVPYREGLVPVSFFKIVAFVKKDKTPSVTGYLLSQKDLIFDLEKVTDEFEFGKFKTYQVPLSKIQEMAGLDLNKLITHDPLKKELESTLKEIQSESDIVL